MWLTLVYRNFCHDHAIYHESDNNIYLRHNLSIGGVFSKNYTGYAGIGIYCCWYEKDGYLNVSLSSPSLTIYSLSSIQHTVYMSHKHRWWSFGF